MKTQFVTVPVGPTVRIETSSATVRICYRRSLVVWDLSGARSFHTREPDVVFCSWSPRRKKCRTWVDAAVGTVNQQHRSPFRPSSRSTIRTTARVWRLAAQPFWMRSTGEKSTSPSSSSTPVKWASSTRETSRAKLRLFAPVTSRSVKSSCLRLVHVHISVPLPKMTNFAAPYSSKISRANFDIFSIKKRNGYFKIICVFHFC